MSAPIENTDSLTSNTTISTVTNIAGNSILQTDLRVKNCNINLEELKNEIWDLFKNPNPINLYMNSNKIRDKFTDFVNCLSNTIVSWFSLDNTDWIVYSIYKNAKYDDIWSNFLKNYVHEFKYFDFLTYLNFVIISDNDKQYLAKWLLKMYKWEKKENIEKMLQVFSSKLDFSKIEEYYLYFDIKDFHIDLKYLDENKVNYFLQEIYFALAPSKRELFLDIFNLDNKNFNPNFTRTVKIVWLVLENSPYYQENIYSYVNKEENKALKMEIDSWILNYSLDKRCFYEEVYKIIHRENWIERKLFWKYIKIEIINKYYKEIKSLFYFYSANNFASKEIFNTFKWSIDYSKLESDLNSSIITSTHYAQITQLKELKNLLIELNQNIFSFFLNPMVYSIISERLKIQQKDLWKLEYLLFYIFADNYTEYKNLYMFFNQLEAFMNSTWKVSVIEKIKVSFSLILLSTLVITFTYFYLPIWVFLGLLFLLMIKWFEFYYPDLYFRGKTNLGLKFFATLILIMSSYFWLISDTNSKAELAHAIDQVKQVWIMPSDQAMKIWINYVKASLFDIK